MRTRIEFPLKKISHNNRVGKAIRQSLREEISDSYSGKHNLEMRNLGVSIRNVTIKSDSVTDWLTGYLSAGLVNILPGNYLIGARFSTMLYFSILR